MRSSTRFFRLPVERSAMARTEAAPPAGQRSQRGEPRKPAPPRTTPWLPCMEACATAARYSAAATSDLVESLIAPAKSSGACPTPVREDKSDLVESLLAPAKSRGACPTPVREDKSD